MLWLRKNRPEVWAKTHKLLGVQDYVAYLLTGNYVTDWSQACRTRLLDLRTFEWNQKLLRLFDLPEDMLCALCPPGGSAGGLSEDYARRSGVVPAGVPRAAVRRRPAVRRAGAWPVRKGLGHGQHRHGLLCAGLRPQAHFRPQAAHSVFGGGHSRRVDRRGRHLRLGRDLQLGARASCSTRRTKTTPSPSKR